LIREQACEYHPPNQWSKPEGKPSATRVHMLIKKRPTRRVGITYSFSACHLLPSCQHTVAWIPTFIPSARVSIMRSPRLDVKPLEVPFKPMAFAVGVGCEAGPEVRTRQRPQLQNIPTSSFRLPRGHTINQIT
jgi:hypothetical protein